MILGYIHIMKLFDVVSPETNRVQKKEYKNFLSDQMLCQLI